MSDLRKTIAMDGFSSAKFTASGETFQKGFSSAKLQAAANNSGQSSTSGSQNGTTSSASTPKK